MKEAPMRALSVLLPLVVAEAATTHVYTGRLNDVFRVPGASLRCDVYRLGHPDTPVWTAKGRP
jgi:hypothetical protein